MSDKFLLTAQLHLQAPTNTKQVLKQIQNQLKGANVNVQLKNAKQTVTQLKQTAKQLQTVQKQAKGAETQMDRLGKAFGQTLKYIVRYDLARRVFSLFTNAIEQGTRDAIAFEREMVKVSQVTGKSMRQLSGLTKEIGNLAKAYGTSSAQLVKTARVLSQTGMAAKDVEMAMKSLAKSTLAPTFDNITDTAETAIAAMRQFRLETSQLEGLLNKINVVAGNFAVEASDIGAAIKRAGGAFASAGGQVEEFIALFTSVRATTRETAETIATGMRTIFTRIQRPKTIQFLKQFGVELQNLEGQFIGPYQAVEQLNKALAGLDPKDVRYSMIIEQLGGFRQVSKVIPLIQQFGTAQDALNKQMSSQGSLSADAAKAQKTLAVQIAQLTENVKELFRNITSSATFQVLAKGAITFANAIVKAADAISGLIPIIGALFAVKGMKWLMGGGMSTILGSGGGRPRPYGPAPQGFSQGGWVPGTGSGDTVPAYLEPGEFVIRKRSAKKLGPRLNSLNKYAGGGVVSAKHTETIDGDTYRATLRNSGKPYSSRTRLKDYDAAEKPTSNEKAIWKAAGVTSEHPGITATRLAADYASKLTDKQFTEMFIGQGMGAHDRPHYKADALGKQLVNAGVGSPKGKNFSIYGWLLENEGKKKADEIRSLGQQSKLGYVRGGRDGYNRGGKVRAPNSLLTPGEFVVNKKSAKRIGYGTLGSLNRYANGGIAGGGLGFGGGGLKAEQAQALIDAITNLVPSFERLQLVSTKLGDGFEATKKAGKELTKFATATAEAGAEIGVQYARFKMLGGAINAGLDSLGLQNTAFETLVDTTMQVKANLAAMGEAANQLKGDFGDAAQGFFETLAGSGKLGKKAKGFAEGGGIGKIRDRLTQDAEAAGRFGVGGKGSRDALKMEQEKLPQMRKQVEAKQAELDAANKAVEKAQRAQAYKAPGDTGKLDAAKYRQQQATQKLAGAKGAVAGGEKQVRKAQMKGMAIQAAAALATSVGKKLEAKGMAAAEAGEGSGYMAASGRALGMAGQGAQMGAMFGPIGAAAGAAAGAIVGFMTGLRDAKLAIAKAKLGEVMEDTAKTMQKFRDGTATAAEVQAKLNTQATAIDDFRAEGMGGVTGSAAGNTAMGVGGGALAGAAIGAAVGSVVPVIGTAVGAVVGAIGGAVTGFFMDWAGPDTEAVSGEWAKSTLEMQKNIKEFRTGVINTSKSFDQFQSNFGSENIDRIAKMEGKTREQVIKEITKEIAERNKQREAAERLVAAQEEATKQMVRMQQLGQIFDELSFRMEGFGNALDGLANITGSVKIGSIGSALSSERMASRDQASRDRYTGNVDALTNMVGEGDMGLKNFADSAKGGAILSQELGRALTMNQKGIGVTRELDDEGNMSIVEGSFAQNVMDTIPKELADKIPPDMYDQVKDNIADMVVAEGGLENLQKKIKEDPDALVKELTGGLTESNKAFEQAGKMLDSHNAKLQEAYAKRNSMEMSFIKTLQDLNTRRASLVADDRVRRGGKGMSTAEARALDAKNRGVAMNAVSAGTMASTGLTAGSGPKEIAKAMAKVREDIKQSDEQLATQGVKGVTMDASQGLADSQKDLIKANADLKSDYEKLQGVMQQYASSQQEMIALNKELEQQQKKQKTLEQLAEDMAFGTAEQKGEAAKVMNELAKAKTMGIGAVDPEYQRQIVGLLKQTGNEDLVTSTINRTAANAGVMLDPKTGGIKGVTTASDKRNEIADRMKELDEQGLAAAEGLASEEGQILADFSAGIESLHQKFLSELFNMLAEARKRELEDRKADLEAEQEVTQKQLDFFGKDAAAALGIEDISKLKFMDGDTELTGAAAMERIIQGGFLGQVTQAQNIQSNLAGNPLAAAVMGGMGTEVLDDFRDGSHNAILKQLGISKADVYSTGSDAGEDTDLDAANTDMAQHIAGRMGEELSKAGFDIDGETLQKRLLERLSPEKMETLGGFDFDDWISGQLEAIGRGARNQVKLTGKNKAAFEALQGANATNLGSGAQSEIDKLQAEAGIEAGIKFDIGKANEDLDKSITKLATTVNEMADLDKKTGAKKVEQAEAEAKIEQKRQEENKKVADKIKADTGVPVASVGGSAAPIAATTFNASPIVGMKQDLPTPMSVSDMPDGEWVGPPLGQTGPQAEAKVIAQEMTKQQSIAPSAASGGGVSSFISKMGKGLSNALSKGSELISEIDPASMKKAMVAAQSSSRRERLAELSEQIKGTTEQQGRFKAIHEKGTSTNILEDLNKYNPVTGFGMFDPTFQDKTGMSQDFVEREMGKGAEQLKGLKAEQASLLAEEKMAAEVAAQEQAAADEAAKFEPLILAITDGSLAIVEAIENSAMSAEQKRAEAEQAAQEQAIAEQTKTPEQLAQEAAKSASISTAQSQVDSLSKYGLNTGISTASNTLRREQERQAAEAEAAKKQEELAKQLKNGADQAMGQAGATDLTADQQKQLSSKLEAPGSEGLLSALGVEPLQEQVERLGSIFENALQVEVGGTIDVNVNMNGAEALANAEKAFGTLASKKATDAINNFISEMNKGGNNARPKQKENWTGSGQTFGEAD